MKHHRTSAQWQELLAQRNDFNGSNIEFCKQHDIAVTTFYKQRALLASSSEANFVKVTQTTETLKLAHCEAICLQTRAGKLSFSNNVTPHMIIDIIKGLSQ